jgi:hypothetical protein
VPFADHRRLVTCALQFLGDVIALGVERFFERVDAVFVAVLAGENRGRLGVQMEFVQKQLESRTPERAMRSMFGVWLMRLP